MALLDEITSDTIRYLYKSYHLCADYLSRTIFESMHISTPVEDKLILATKKKKIIFVTGNPGDGKTHLIRKVSSEFPKNTEVILDANELTDEKLRKHIDKAYEKKASLVVAINEGILLDLCENVKMKTLWAETVIDMILRPYIYNSETKKLPGQISVLDLNLRNNLSFQITEQAIDRVIGLVPKTPESPFLSNITSLENPAVKKRITILLDAVGKTGFHATMRDLFGFLAFLICGGENPDEGIKPNPYYINAFGNGVGPLFDRVRDFDPLYMASPFLDECIFMGEDNNEDWEKEAPEEYITPGNIAIFKNRKRRAFFEHKEGENIFKSERSDIDKAFKKLSSKGSSPESVAVDLLNRFFGGSKGPESLALWFGHQYCARALKYVASRQDVGSSEFEVLQPQLPHHIAEAFSDHYPDYVIFKHRDMPISEGLIMDRRFVGMLMAGDRLSGFGIRSLEVQTKVATFYDRLAKLCTLKKPVVQILRLDNQKIERIGIKEEDLTYFIPGA